jgi:TM2 domain-containing membrane protein YozV
MSNNPSKPPGMPPPPSSGTMACPHCRQPIAMGGVPPGSSFTCPSCRQLVQPGAFGYAGSPYAPPGAGGGYYPGQVDYHAFVSKKVAAGVCGILLGGLGVHKFILGFNQAGIIMLVVNLMCAITGACLIIPILGSMAMGIIGLVEGIIYLSKSDQEFFETYAIQRREWF